MTQTKDQSVIKLREARIRFCNLFVPKAPAISGENTRPRYDATFMIKKGSDNDKAIRAAVERIAADKWKGQAKAKLQQLGTQDRIQYRDGDVLAGSYPEYEGHMILSATKPETQAAPVVRDASGRNVLEAPDGLPYPGCWVNALVQPYYFDKIGGPRINCGLIAVQMYREDEAFQGAGYRVTDDDFEDLSVDSLDEDIPW